MDETPSHEHRMSYRIGRGEQGVLTFEPYKSVLLPLWRFKTVRLAQESSQKLWQKFEDFGRQQDFVGMDMTRKFIQLGMTRAKRYANHPGGRKYAKLANHDQCGTGQHPGASEKLAASNIFREVWDRCRTHQGYQALKHRFIEEQRNYLKTS